MAKAKLFICLLLLGHLCALAMSVPPITVLGADAPFADVITPALDDV